MRPESKTLYLDSAFLPKAFLVWCLTSLVLLVLSSILLNELGCTERSLGYVSSAISFLSALAAGIVAASKRKSGTIYTALITAVALIIFLLTIGFLIDGGGIEASAVMSIVSFSFCGAIVGVICFPAKGQKRKRHKFT